MGLAKTGSWLDRPPGPVPGKPQPAGPFRPFRPFRVSVAAPFRAPAGTVPAPSERPATALHYSSCKRRRRSPCCRLQGLQSMAIHEVVLRPIITLGLWGLFWASLQVAQALRATRRDWSLSSRLATVPAPHIEVMGESPESLSPIPGVSPRVLVALLLTKKHRERKRERH